MYHEIMVRAAIGCAVRGNAQRKATDRSTVDACSAADVTLNQRGTQAM